MKKLVVALVAAVAAGGIAYWILSEPPQAPKEESVSVATQTSAPPATAPATAVPANTSASVATATSVAPPPPTPAAEFARKAESVQAALPTVEQMKKLPVEQIEHRTPKPVFEAGAQIGEIAEAIEKNPSLAPQGLEFYGKCARRTDVSFTARALCLVNLRELAVKQRTQADENGIAPDVVKLADKLKTVE